MIVLDATFRDGGYYNNWEFGLDLADEYLSAMKQSKINAIEIGFRSPPDKEIGIFGNADDYLIMGLNIPNIEYFGVMVNSSEMTADLVKYMFMPEKVAPINLVRAATHFAKIDEAEPVLSELKKLGYTVCCNLMQAADKSYVEIRDAAAKIDSWGSVDVLYLADSLGGMEQDAVNYAFDALRKGWSGLTGFHAHNNKGQALSNTLEAIDIGVDWVDSTVMGMGRGPGNTETEYLLNELNKRYFEFETEPVYRLVMNRFYNLKEQYGWGPSLPYYLSAEYNIHPTYIQKMLSESYRMNKILNAINRLRDIQSNSFDVLKYEEALHCGYYRLHSST